MMRDWIYRFLALVMAIFCWYLVSGQEKVETWLDVAVEFVNLPPRMEVVSGFPSKVQARVRGTSNQVRALGNVRLAYKIDLSTVRPGKNVVPLVPENMPLTSAVEIVEFNPSRLEFEADVQEQKEVPVRLDWSGEPGPDMRVVNATVDPEKVVVTGLASALKNLKAIRTEAVTVEPGDRREVSGRVRLVLPAGVRAEVGSVAYSLRFAPISQEVWIKFSVESVSRDVAFTLEPRTVRARLEVPVALLRDKDWRDKLHLRVDPGTGLAPGEYAFVPVLDAPEDVRVLELRPEKVTVIVKEENP
ncbi:MAG: YbbR family protein [Desulfomicrobiaceae bacterium]|jgi:YbbR domain-containing protein|nr:YbbR family protein [Desulfomicrobiaceae bacterium]